VIDYLSLKAEAEKLRQDLLTQRWYNAGLRQQIATISERMRADSRDSVLIQQWYADASLMYALHAGGLSISRRKIVPEILSRSRWAYATGFMSLSGVFRRDDGIVVVNPNEARMAFDAARKTLEEKGVAYLSESGHLFPRSAR